MGKHFDYENTLGGLGLQLMVVCSVSMCEVPCSIPSANGEKKKQQLLEYVFLIPRRITKLNASLPVSYTLNCMLERHAQI